MYLMKTRGQQIRENLRFYSESLQFEVRSGQKVFSVVCLTLNESGGQRSTCLCREFRTVKQNKG